MTLLSKAVFFDRDGVLNETLPGLAGTMRPPHSVSELRLMPGAYEAVCLAKASGYLPIVVTNQPDVSRGVLTPNEAEAINVSLREQISAIVAVYACLHDNDDKCTCRKPKPGMLVRAANDFNLDLEASWLIGDRWVDIAAASSAGCQSVLLKQRDSWSSTSIGGPSQSLLPTLEAADVLDAVSFITRAKQSFRSLG